MTSRELLNLILSGPTSDSLPLELRRAFFKLHDHLHEVELRCGKRVTDIPDMMELCREIIDHLTPARRISEPFRTHDVCPRCYHVHQQPGECGVDLGKGGICDCKAEVTA